MTPSPDIPEKEIRERCNILLKGAAEEALKLSHNYIGVEHLFMTTTRNESGAICKLLRRAGLDPHEVRREIRRDVGTGEEPLEEVLPLTPRAAMILSLAIFLAERDEEDEISEEHFLMALLQEGESVPVRILVDMGFDINLWLQRLIMEENDDEFPDMVEPKNDFEFDDIERAFGRNHLSPSPDREDDSNSDHHLPTPLLDKYGRDLTQQAREGKIHAAIARDHEIRALARTLVRSKKNNPLLLGDAGVGKTAVVEGLAYAIADGSAPPSLLNRRVVQIEIGTLVAGTSLRGQFEERLIGIVDEIKRAETVILFIDEIHTIVGAGDTIDSNLDAANILKPALARGELVCIGATTHEEYRRAIAQDPALTRRFRTIDIEEPTEADTLAILAGQRDRLQDHHGVHISSDALEAAVRLSVRYLTDRRLPDKALDLLDEACTRVIIRSVSPDEEDTNLEDGEAMVTVEIIADVLSDWTGIPVNDLSQDERHRLAHLEDALLKRIIGQDEAVNALAGAIKTARAGLGDPNRPVGAFLFLGPSGVGKTELALALAENMFGDEDAVIRLDMSEFHDSHTVARLIGAPPGYRDTQRGGQLTDALRRRPYSVVLLDEVEKAAPEVFDIFLQVFDEGRLSDARGGVVDARHAVFIMTSNIGTEESAKAMGFTATTNRKDSFLAQLSRFFRPEFLNRIDEVIIFNPLSHDTLDKILDLEMQELHQRLSNQKLKLVLTDDARAFILDKGSDADNGARHLRRAVERYVTRPLSARIVEDSFESGDTIHAYTTDNNELRFEARTTDT
ncbi:MAG: ATP-dependent Clp protease ATP-binding subunit ClpC [Anaerolineaceae bacterium]|nr:ATP-dependent Clp protease ATP-binding subunit ClpC [Anaerolineaceae bacterium]